MTLSETKVMLRGPLKVLKRNERRTCAECAIDDGARMQAPFHISFCVSEKLIFRRMQT